jgi:uncharacterized OB-fold protein
MTRRAALKALKDRKAHPPKRIRNEDLYAGSAMTYYCRSCGHVSDVLPEEHSEPPRRLCTECEEMNQKGWLPAA